MVSSTFVYPQVARTTTDISNQLSILNTTAYGIWVEKKNCWHKLYYKNSAPQKGEGDKSTVNWQ